MTQCDFSILKPAFEVAPLHHSCLYVHRSPFAPSASSVELQRIRFAGPIGSVRCHSAVRGPARTRYYADYCSQALNRESKQPSLTRSDFVATLRRYTDAALERSVGERACLSTGSSEASALWYHLDRDNKGQVRAALLL